MPWQIALEDAQILAVHAALLPTGNVLYFGGDEHSKANFDDDAFDNSRIYDVAHDSISPLEGMTTDAFCCGHAFLPDGRLLLGGGTEAWIGPHAGEGHDEPLEHWSGSRACWAYEARNGEWCQVASLLHQPGETTGGGRWYPSLLTLADGRILAVGGHPSITDTRHGSWDPEVFSPGSNSWAYVGGQQLYLSDPMGSDFLYYPRMHVLPSGDVLLVSRIEERCRIYDPESGGFVQAIELPFTSGYSERTHASVLLPLLPEDSYRAHVLFLGQPQARTLTVDTSDPNTTPEWVDTLPRDWPGDAPRRRNSVAVLLPTGDVAWTGGINDADDLDAGAVRQVETYRPEIDWAAGTYTGPEDWTTDPPEEAAQITRNYHSVALLLPDGRVWTAGSNRDAQNTDPDNREATMEEEVEVYSPAYVAMAGRPQITEAPASLGYGDVFVVETPQADAVQTVALLRCGSVTHGWDGDQRFVSLQFIALPGDRLLVSAPPHGGIAPPGPYMLWLVDDQRRPCQQAAMVRVSDQACHVVADRSTFSVLEVQAVMTNEGAAFNNALYVVFDGFLEGEVSGEPSIELRFDGATGPSVQGMTLELQKRLQEVYKRPDIAQCVSFVYRVRFDDTSAFDAIENGTRFVHVRALLGHRICEGFLNLTLTPNPYMVDGSEHWVSTDVRVFQIRSGESRAGVSHDGSAIGFLDDLLDVFRSDPDDLSHPFLDISTSQTTSKLELASHVNDDPVFNYAIAKVRYRAETESAQNVRVFFRLFNTVGTALQYDTAKAYRRSEDGPNAIALLGRRSGEVVSVPFFAQSRVDTTAASMTTQVDSNNRRTLPGAGATETVEYYGCWLDFNQTTPRFPVNPVDDGPYPADDVLSIQELVRGVHHCVVAEIYLEDDPTPHNATPGTSDNLSQRNVLIEESANPGAAASRTVLHTLEVGTSPFATGVPNRFRLNQLVFRWHSLPSGTDVDVFIPSVAADDIVALEARRHGPAKVAKVDDNTVRLVVTGDFTTFTMPPSAVDTVAALVTVRLPEGIVNGQVFSLSVHEYSGVLRRFTGAVQFSIPVRHAGAIRAAEERKLSVLRHIAEAIPTTNRWHRVFERYLDELAARVDALGGDSGSIEPSSDGSGRRHRVCPPSTLEECCTVILCGVIRIFSNMCCDVARVVRACLGVDDDRPSRGLPARKRP